MHKNHYLSHIYGQRVPDVLWSKRVKYVFKTTIWLHSNITNLHKLTATWWVISLPVVVTAPIKNNSNILRQPMKLFLSYMISQRRVRTGIKMWPPLTHYDQHLKNYLSRGNAKILMLSRMFRFNCAKQNWTIHHNLKNLTQQLSVTGRMYFI